MPSSHRPSSDPADGPPTSAGDAESLLALVYDDLRRLAAARLRVQAGSVQTLDPTALVHEAYLRLVKDGDPGWPSRAYFFGAAARAMRNILVERARGKARIKRGGDRRRVALDDVPSPGDDAPMKTLHLDRLVTALERERPRLAELAMLHLFVGMTHEQIALSLGVSVRTVERDWRLARAIMQRALDRDIDGGAE